MIKKTLKAIVQSNFLKSSAIVFIVNLTIGVFNYAIIIVAGRVLLNEFSVWTAMTGLMAIMITPMSGIMTEYTKKVAQLSQTSISDSLEYFSFIKRKLSPLIMLSVAISALAILTHFTFSGNEKIVVILGLVVYMMLNVNTNIRSQYLLGILKVKKYAIVVFATSLARLVPTVVLLYLNFGVLALPLGLIISCVLGIFIGEMYVSRTGEIVSYENLRNKFSLKKDIISASKNMFALLLILTFFNISPIITEITLNKTQQDLFAVIFNFGQIIHFGALSFMGVLVAYASRGKNLKLYLISVSIVAGVAMIIGLVFAFFGSALFVFLNRPQYATAVNLIVAYSIFVALYNIIFVSIQYLISNNEYRKLLALPFFVMAIIFVNIVTTTNSIVIFGFQILSFNKLVFFNDEVLSLILGSIFVSIFAALYYFVITIKLHPSKTTNEKETLSTL